VLKTRILHPEILRALASAGHGARVLIADGNYPFSTEAPAGATRVFLNLRRGLVSVTDVLEALVDTIPIESVQLMAPADGQPVAIHETIRRLVPDPIPLERRKRHEFYTEAKLPATALVIATGEERRFANVLLTIGVVTGAAAESSSSPARQAGVAPAAANGGPVR
jgi:L-fucose mutarotase